MYNFHLYFTVHAVGKLEKRRVNFVDKETFLLITQAFTALNRIPLDTHINTTCLFIRL